MDLKTLPSGRDFRVSGAKNFTKKLNQATRFGDLKNLRDNKESILKALKPVERTIRLGKFGRLSQMQVMAKIKALEGYKLTKDDKRDIKKLFSHLSGKNASQVNKSSVVGENFAGRSAETASDIILRRSNTISTKLSGGRVRPINRDPNNNISYNGISIQTDRDPSRVIRTQTKTTDHSSSLGSSLPGLRSVPGKTKTSLGRLF